MEVLSNLALGFQTAGTLENLMYCFIGVFLGTAIGVLPGIGPLATIAMLLPITYQLSDPTTALIMLAGIYYGSQYGGSTTAILVNLPGESASVVTVLDGYQMARQGRAGPALAIAAIGSFFAGTVATFMLAAFAPPLAEVAFKFGPAEYFSLMVLGLVAAVVLANGSVVKALGMVVLGLLLGMIGTDVNSGVARFSFDIPELTDGVEFAVVAMGMFGFAEIILNLEQKEDRSILAGKITGLFPTMADLKASRDADRARHAAGLLPRHPAGRRRHAVVLLQLCAGEEAVQDTRSVSARARSKASPARKPPTTPARRCRSCRC